MSRPSFESDRLSDSGSIASNLLARIKAQDAEAWRRLVRVYGPVVYGWCSQAGLRADDAADIGQEVFRAVAAGITSFRRDSASDTFVGWLRVVTRNKVADYRRRQAKSPQAIGGSEFQFAMSQLPEPSEARVPNETDPSSVHAVLFRRALELIRAEFEEKTWRAFWATAVEGQATRDVGADMGMTPMAVRKAKSRVLRRLRDEFQGEMGD